MLNRDFCPCSNGSRCPSRKKLDTFPLLRIGVPKLRPIGDVPISNAPCGVPVAGQPSAIGKVPDAAGDGRSSKRHRHGEI
jgi:hypothetical protein